VRDNGGRLIITCTAIKKRAIQAHYDLATPFYRLLWGPHIHHGLWEADEPPDLAQRQLIDRLASTAGISAGERILDVGCGMGGTAIDLARRLGCRVTGLTLSPVQQAWASLSAWWQGAGRLARFLRRDAEKAKFPPAAFDVVWSVECTEHLFDKPAFFRRGANWLRPGGRMALCAWLAGDGPDAAEQAAAVCEGFLCPSLGTMADYCDWMAGAGMRVTTAADLTAQVSRTWEICLERVRRSGVRWLAPLLGRDMARFVECFETILNAYRTGAMRYGLFVGVKEHSPLAA
jgi:tocopherol O-methyltransferase